LLSVDEVLRKVDQVQATGVDELAKEFLTEPLAISVIGPYKKLRTPIGFVPPHARSRS